MKKLYDGLEEVQFSEKIALQPQSVEDAPVETVAESEPEREAAQTEEVYFEPREEEKVSSDFDDMFSNIKKNAEKSIEEEDKFKVYFTEKNVPSSLELDGTNFFPNTMTLLAGKNFSAKYAKQLNNVIFDKKGEINEDSLMTVIYLVNMIETGKAPIQIKSAKMVAYKQKIVKALNEYFNKNYVTLLSIYTMFNGTAYKYRQAET